MQLWTLTENKKIVMCNMALMVRLASLPALLAVVVLTYPRRIVLILNPACLQIKCFPIWFHSSAFSKDLG